MSGQILFGRYARVEVGVPGQEGRVIESVFRDDDGLLVPGIRIAFKIEKTADAAPNKAHIDIYNLHKDTINLLRTKGAVIILYAGYGGILDRSDPKYEVIFRGDVVKCQTLKQPGGDYITTIENGDGIAAFQNSQYAGSFSAGAQVNDVLSSVVSSFTGIGRGEIADVSGQYVNGVTLSGSSRDAMDQVTAKTGSEWSIQDGMIQVMQPNAATKEPVIVLQSTENDEQQNTVYDTEGNPINTGLIGSPTRSGFSHSKEKKFSGVEFKSLLQPGLKPGRRVLLKSIVDELSGTYIVRKVTHNGDSKQGPWYSECEGASP